MALIWKIEKIEESQAHTIVEKKKMREEFKVSVQHEDFEERSENYMFQQWKEGDGRPPPERLEQGGNNSFMMEYHGNHRNMSFQHTFGGGSNSGDHGNWRFCRLEFPIFSGKNSDSWILRAERYFSFYHLGDDEMVEAAVVGLDGDALLWFQ